VAWRVSACLPFVLLVAAVCAGCSQDRVIDQQQEKLESLAASAETIGRAWLDGSVSSTYARTALERTYQLAEQERSTLARSPQYLANPRGARLSQDGERLARTIASMMEDVRRGDVNSGRTHLSSLPFSGTVP
jgi:hypothetical protein